MSKRVATWSQYCDCFYSNQLLESGEGIELLSMMKEAGVAPNVVTYNAVIDGVVISGKYDEALMFKEKMVEE
ncbi:hypothetical protein Bca52824_028119 [Brassica carinata]|uniref:Pentatricopeptide repeat-containing protein n=1 Tax=Brassica carinata TaxID=52824 RepID=A0A8X7VBQ2_BRACI|nr:hypothetical protein Bca52824_028119 [Brassica carinata]